MHGEIDLAALSGTYALLVADDSMAPRFAKGDRLIADPQAQYQSGKYYVVQAADKRTWAKRVIKDTGRYMLMPESATSEVIFLGESEVAFLHRIRMNELV